jgi:hypothetical protein
MRTLALVSAFTMLAVPAAACEPVEYDVMASRSVRDVLGEVEAVRFDGLAMRGFRVVRRWTATVRPVETLRGEAAGQTFDYSFDDEQPDCGWKDMQVRRGSRAVFFFVPSARSPYWAIEPSDYRLARP